MKVLICCEFSGIVRDAFAALGHDAWSCDLLPSERPGQHIQCEHGLHVWNILEQKWDLVIAHPPCTYLCNSGVRWLKGNTERWYKMEHAVRNFKNFLYCKAPRVCVENPIMHGYAKNMLGVEQSQIIQPWQFGHGEIKATCLWLRGLPALKPSNIVEGRNARVHRASPGPDRWKERSRTLPGIAAAMAEQWGISNKPLDALRHCA